MACMVDFAVLILKSFLFLVAHVLLLEHMYISAYPVDPVQTS